MSKRLARQWLWAGIGLAIIVVVILIKSADLDVKTSGTGDSCKVEVNADVLNVRAAPNGEAAVVDKLSRGAVVDAAAEVNNGYRKLEDNRWVSSQFVTPNDRC